VSPAGVVGQVLAGVELGGTKVVCVVGTGPDDIVAELRLETRGPEETLGAAAAFLAEHAFDALGIASFGPVELRRGHPAWGSITTTPKPGWSGTEVVQALRRPAGTPVAFDTDVNGAALAETRWGSARDVDSVVYVTVGTGVGAGAVVGGRLVHGLVHPEVGHVPIPRRGGDDHPSACAYHPDCWEGLTSGPALAGRFGVRLEDAGAAVRDEAAALAAAYIGSGLRALVYTFAPERIVLGGGVTSLPALHARVRAALRDELAGYPGLPEHDEDAFVAPPALGDRAGSLGALALAGDALAHRA
jgi:fructokinase